MAHSPVSIYSPWYYLVSLLWWWCSLLLNTGPHFCIVLGARLSFESNIGGPCQHGFMSESNQWISESNYNNYAADHDSIRRKSA